MESDNMSSRDDLLLSENNLSIVEEEECSQDGGPVPGSPISLKRKAVRFSEAQNACLNAYYGKGMTGTGKYMHLLISKAAKDTLLSIAQVKRWIKKKSFKRNHCRRSSSSVVPTKKPKKLTPWHVFQKQFWDSEAGKQSMLLGTSEYNKAASSAYSSLGQDKRKNLREIALGQSKTGGEAMSIREIKRTAARTFKKVSHLFQELESIGYRALAFGFFEDDVQTAFTTECSCAITAGVVDYIRSVIVAGNPPALLIQPTHQLSSKPPPTTKPSDPPPSRKPPPNCKPPNQPIHQLSSKPPPTTKPSDPPPSRKPPPNCKPPNQPIHQHLSKPPPTTKPSDPPPSRKPPPNCKPPLSNPSPDCTPSLSNPLPNPTLKDLVCPSTCFLPESDNLHNMDKLPEETIPSSFPEENNSAPHSPLIPLQSTKTDQPIVVSGSSARNTPPVWIPQLNLYISDLQILQSENWLNDAIVSAAQTLLRNKTSGKVLGWQSTQCVKRKQMFKPIPSGTPFIQVLHVSSSHWILTSNITNNGGYLVDTVCVYDSLPRKSVHPNLIQQVCSFCKPPLSCKTIKFDIMNNELQPNGNDCGIYTLACATELAYSHDPVCCSWNVKLMRSHLIKCFEKGSLDRFPTLKSRRVGLGKRVSHTVEVDIYCTCRLPNYVKKPMIECGGCFIWYHKDCMSLDPKKSYAEGDWICTDCEETLKLATK